jgi:multicomponent Na+:H+ antiporter subunit G
MTLLSESLLLLGCAVFLLASIGLFRLPDAMARLHGGTKGSSFAVLLMSVAAAIKFPALEPLALLAGTVFLVFLTAPLACHAIAIRLVDPDQIGGGDS